MDEDVLKFRPLPPEPDRQRPYVAKTGWEDCQHRETWIDAELRTVQCKRCEKYLDPISVLLNWASEERSLDYRIQRINEFEEKQRQKEAKRCERAERARQRKEAKAAGKANDGT